MAIIEDNRLVFSVEMEKLDNGLRYSPLGDLRRVDQILRSEGIDPADVDQFVVDGWWSEDAENPSSVPTTVDGRPFTLPVAPYLDGPGALDPIQRYHFEDHDFSPRTLGYASYHHAANHLLGSYCSSPMAARGEDSLVLVWDGGMTPRLYHVDAGGRTVRAVSALLPIPGNFFADFCSYFGPFHRDTTGFDYESRIRHHLSIAGKAMAYAALGTARKATFPLFDEMIADFPTIASSNAFALGEKVVANRDQIMPGLSDADIIASFQDYLGQLITSSLSSMMRRRFADRRPNLCLAGGCALNIKWNTLLRQTDLFQEIWIPPFPNDSGAAIGTACCEMFSGGGRVALDWDVHSGPRVLTGQLPEGWRVNRCDERQLAEILHSESEPVVVLSGRAEIGPRALGNRSILAPATDLGMRDRLNAIKERASYRPVAPICLTSRAAEVFAPGTADRYMLFEHRARENWIERIPAVIHLDGTSRLQTLDPSDNAAGRILAAYEQLSGIPVLCNTSANLNGHGFFPDVATAARWGRTRYIWSDGSLYTNPDASLGGTTSA